MLLWMLDSVIIFELMLLFLWKNTQSGITGSCSHSIFNFLRKFGTDSVEAVSIYIPTNIVLSFIFLCILANICYFLSFW